MPAANTAPVTLPMIEWGLTLVLTALAFLAPRLGDSLCAPIEAAFTRLARRKGWSVLFVGASALLLRLAILPWNPIPLPICPDDFSYLLAANTFALGRLTNPTPAMWRHMLTIHVDFLPSYQSMYFPAQGLLLAAGKLLFGHPWYGALLAGALMCAALCWMLQAWLPARWALLGGLLAVAHLGLFSYWTNTYHSAGALCALGGALALGALPRIRRSAQGRHLLALALGIALLAITRPYEGLLLSLPVAVSLGLWAWRGALPPSLLLRRAALPALLLAATLGWLGYYNHRVYGGATTLPYTVNRAAYAMAPYYVWQRERPEPRYPDQAMRDYYMQSELRFSRMLQSWSGFVPISLIKLWRSLNFFAGAALLPPLCMLGRLRRDRRVRFLLLCVLVLAAGMAIEVFLLPHYLAVFTAAFYALGLQMMRHLRQWRPENRPVGRQLARFSVMICIAMALVRVFAAPLHLSTPKWPAEGWNYSWYGPGHYGQERQQALERLQREPGRQLAIVRYASTHHPFEEWVYNDPDPDASKVIWARDLGAKENQALILHYQDRRPWLVEADRASLRFYAVDDPVLAHQNTSSGSKPLTPAFTEPKR